MKKVFGRIFVLWLPFIAIAWLGVNLFFYLITTTGGGISESMMVIKSMLNRLLGIASLLSIILFPIGIVFLTKGGKIGDYIDYGRRLAKKNVKQYWLPLLVVFIVVLGINLAIKRFGTIHGLDVEETLNNTGGILTIISYIFGIVYGIGFVKLGLQAGDEKKKFSLKTLFVHKWSEIWKTVTAVILFTLIMIIPVLLAIVLLALGAVAISGGNGYVHLMGTSIPTGLFESLGGNLGVLIGIVFLILGFITICYIVYIGLRINPVLNFIAIDHNNLSPWEMVKKSWKITKGKVWKLFTVNLIAGLTNILGVLALGIGLFWTIPLTLIATAKIYQDVYKEYKGGKEKIEI